MTANRDTVGEIHAYNVDVKTEKYINEFDDSGETGVLTTHVTELY